MVVAVKAPQWWWCRSGGEGAAVVVVVVTLGYSRRARGGVGRYCRPLFPHNTPTYFIHHAARTPSPPRPRPPHSFPPAGAPATARPWRPSRHTKRRRRGRAMSVAVADGCQHRPSIPPAPPSPSPRSSRRSSRHSRLE